MALKLEVAYDFGAEVYLLADPDQEKMIVVGYEVSPGNIIKYKLSALNFVASFFDFEISDTKAVI
jgi:hypothetical protein